VNSRVQGEQNGRFFQPPRNEEANEKEFGRTACPELKIFVGSPNQNFLGQKGLRLSNSVGQKRSSNERLLTKKESLQAARFLSAGPAKKPVNDGACSENAVEGPSQ